MADLVAFVVAALAVGAMIAWDLHCGTFPMRQN